MEKKSTWIKAQTTVLSETKIKERKFANCYSEILGTNWIFVKVRLICQRKKHFIVGAWPWLVLCSLLVVPNFQVNKDNKYTIGINTLKEEEEEGGRERERDGGTAAMEAKVVVQERHHFDVFCECGLCPSLASGLSLFCFFPF